MWLFFGILSHLLFAAPNESIVLKNADSMIRDTTNNTLRLSGNVQLIYQQQYLSCDEAIVYLDTTTIEAVKDVVLTTPTVYAEADKMFINYSTNTGVIYNGYVQSGTVSFEGELIYKTGENDYEAVNSTYSACTTCPPAWSFTGSEIRATFGGYARIKNSVLRLANLPVFWFPYIFVPLKNERQTGILTPSHSRSKRGGNGLSLPFYWVIDDSQDATVTLTTSEFRGLKTNLEYRYALAPGSSGIFNYGYLRDETFSESERVQAAYPNGLRTRDRWYFSYKHLYELPNYYEHRVDLNMASDLQYSFDFSEEFEFYREPSITNRMSLSKYDEDQHMSIDAILHTNQLKTDPLAENEDAVHKIPELRWSLKTQKVGDSNLHYNLETNYVNYARSYYAYDDINDDGDYDEGTDKIRTGQRLILKPELFYPVQVGPYLNVVPSVSYQENIYKFTDATDTTPYSRYLQTRLSIRSNAARVFDSGDPNANAYKHEIVPFVTLVKTPFIQRSDDSFVGPKDLIPYSSDQSISDIDTLQFDFRDRLPQRDVIEFGFRNSLSRRRNIEGTPQIKEIAAWGLSQKFDLREAESSDPKAEPWSNITSTLELYFDKFEAYQTLYYYPYQNHVNSSTRLRFYPTISNYLELAYNQAFVIRKGEQVDSNVESQDILLSTVLKFKNANFAGSAEYSNVTHDFEKYSVGVQLKPPGDCWNFSVSQIFNSQDTVISFKFEFLFDGVNDDKFTPESLF
jgi:LPS-assembly protein